MGGDKKDNLEVILMQIDIAWEDPQTNYETIKNLVQGTSADIYFLPEMFSTGFTMQPEKIAEPFCGPSFKFLQQMAIEKDAAFTASIPTKMGGEYYNRLYWVEPNETFITYDKRHLFSFVGEDKHYSAGKERKIIDYKGWKFLPQVCYDLRFPVFSRNQNDYDVLYYVANWPERRSYAWNQLLKARAIENMSYCIGVNRIGQDNNGIAHNGDSMVYNAVGNGLDNISKKDGIKSYTLVKQDLIKTRKKYNFLNDRDDFTINF